MNDHINHPKKLYEEIKDKANVIILSPNEQQDLSSLKQNLASIDILGELLLLMLSEVRESALKVLKNITRSRYEKSL